ncbi:hypothetical protein ACERIT_01305 [Halopenitus sp. H-Gu1]|uniref:DUF7283 family protein n=1 Tax=Halopenitus sp. H-Gu1 TaxID=3242697 RepID=UPI00359F0B5D
MFDVPIDAWYAWLGIAGMSLLTLGIAAGIPAGPTPDAMGVAGTIDRVAASEYPATAEHGLAADQIRLTPNRISLRGPGGATTAVLEFAPVTPARGDDRLYRVLKGEPPDRGFESPESFSQVAAETRTQEPRWRSAPPRLRIRTVTWEGERVTLVG